MTFIWEQFKECSHYQNSDAWSKIGDYVKENNCIMFFNKCDDEHVFLIANGVELQTILGESFGFEFYITDRDQSYVICFNHHDLAPPKITSRFCLEKAIRPGLRRIKSKSMVSKGVWFRMREV